MAQTDLNTTTGATAGTTAQPRSYPILLAISIIGLIAKVIVSIASGTPIFDWVLGGIAGLLLLTLIIFLTERSER